MDGSGGGTDESRDLRGRCPGDLPPQVSGAGRLSPRGQRKRGPRPATLSVSAMPAGSPSPPSPFVQGEGRCPVPSVPQERQCPCGREEQLGHPEVRGV